MIPTILSGYEFKLRNKKSLFYVIENNLEYDEKTNKYVQKYDYITGRNTDDFFDPYNSESGKIWFINILDIANNMHDTTNENICFVRLVIIPDDSIISIRKDTDKIKINYVFLKNPEKLLDVLCEKLSIEQTREIIHNFISNHTTYHPTSMIRFLKNIPDKIKTKSMCRDISYSNYKAFKYFPSRCHSRKIVYDIVSYFGNNLYYVPVKLRTRNLCKLAMIQSTKAFMYTPEKFKTYDICKFICIANGQMLKFVPKKHMCEELCEIAVTRRGMVLEYVPENIMNDKIFRLALENNGNAIRFIPYKYRSYELCLLAITNDVNSRKRYFDSFKYIPHQYRTKELIKKMIENNLYALKFLSFNERTEELCDIVLDNVKYDDVKIFEYIPSEYLTFEKIKKLIEKNRFFNKDLLCMLEYCPKNNIIEFFDVIIEKFSDDFLSFNKKYIIYCEIDEKYNIQIQKNILKYITDNTLSINKIEEYSEKTNLFLEVIPDDMKTKKICDLAIIKYKYDLSYVPKNLMTFDLFILHIDEQKNKRTYDKSTLKLDKINDIPNEYFTHSICKQICENFCNAGDIIPSEKMTNKLYKKIMKHSTEILQSLRIDEYINYALENVPDALKYIKYTNRTYDICKKAVELNGMMLEYVPLNHRTKELCKIAITQNKDAVSFDPRNKDENSDEDEDNNEIKKEYVTNLYVTEELCKQQVAKNGLNLWSVPNKFKTEEMCQIAVTQNNLAIKYVPIKMRTYKICSIIIDDIQDIKAMKYLPKEFKIEENVDKMIDKCGFPYQSYKYFYQYLPENLLYKYKKIEIDHCY